MVRAEDSDQEMEDVQKTKKTVKKASEPEDDEQQANNGEEGSEEEEEYEIERILDAKRGMFPDGHLGYLVKWKGYDHTQNSWVNEEDAVNATELIDDFWRRKKGGRKSDAPKPKPKPTPTSSVKAKQAEVSEAEEEPPKKKRARPSKSKSIEISDDEVEPKPKKAKQPPPQSKATPSGKSGRKSTDVAPSDAMDEDGQGSDAEPMADMSKLFSRDSWENLVNEIQTVERTDDGKLWVYFTLTKQGRKAAGGGLRAREEASVCKKKMAEKLCDFYEHNLRWRKTEGDEPEED